MLKGSDCLPNVLYVVGLFFGLPSFFVSGSVEEGWSEDKPVRAFMVNFMVGKSVLVFG